MADVPAPIKAVIGLVAEVIDKAPTLSERATQWPVLAVSSAMQWSMRLQQEYAALIGRGEQVLSDLRPPSDEPPSWAVFDDEPTADEPTADEPTVDPADDPVETETAPERPAAKKRARKPSAFDLTTDE